MRCSIRRWVCLFAGLLACAAHGAIAACVRYVGDAAGDSQCTDDTIQSAIDHVDCAANLVVITGEHTYTAQHLHIDGKNVTLKGTVNPCGKFIEPDPPPTTPSITISGAGHSGDSVLYIHGASQVTLQSLMIEGGDNLGGYGGAIHFDGSGSVTLDTTTVRNNRADYGGGIAFTGSGGPATLTLGAYSQLLNNSAAQSGGGIRIDGDGYLKATHDHTLIALNHAPDGYGGGVNVVGPGRADIGSAGLGVGVIYSNHAKYGGGLAITSRDDDDASVQLFGTDALSPVRVTGNTATSSGGGIYMKGYVGTIGSFTFSRATLCAKDFQIDDNAAPEGAAIDADDAENPTFESGSVVVFNDCSGGASARRCAVGIPCNTLDGNVVEDAQGSPTLGAVVRVHQASTLDGDRFSMRGNRGGYAIHTSGDSADASASNCLFADNDFSRQLLNSEGGPLDIRNCTLTHNAILSTDTIHAEGTLTLIDSIIDQPGNLALAYSGSESALHVSHVLSSDTSTLPASSTIVNGSPTYVDGTHGDYHLDVASPGIDFAPAIGGDDIDLDGLLRDQDLPLVPNVWGSRDLGAYEHPRTYACTVNDTIFCNGLDDF